MRISIVIPVVLVICIIIISATYILGQKDAEPGPVKPDPDKPTSNTTPVNVSATPDRSDLPYSGSENNGDAGTVNFQLQYGKNRFINDAKVGLYTNSYTNSDLTLLEIPGNPLEAANADKSNSGPVYQFTNVPYGKYYVIAEKNGKTYKSSGLLQSATDDGVLRTMADAPDLEVPSSAKLSSGTIYGWVRHEFHYDYMPGVRVTLLKQDSADDTQFIPVNDADGQTISESSPYSGFFAFEDVEPGTYRLKTEYNGQVRNSKKIEVAGNEETGIQCDVYSF